MLHLLLILMGLISNPSNANTATNDDNGATIITTQSDSGDTDPGDTSGDEGHTPKK